MKKSQDLFTHFSPKTGVDYFPNLLPNFSKESLGLCLWILSSPHPGYVGKPVLWERVWGREEREREKKETQRERENEGLMCGVVWFSLYKYSYRDGIWTTTVTSLNGKLGRDAHHPYCLSGRSRLWHTILRQNNRPNNKKTEHTKAIASHPLPRFQHSTSSVTLGKLLNSSEAQFPHFYNRGHKYLYLVGFAVKCTTLTMVPNIV